MKEERDSLLSSPVADAIRAGQVRSFLEDMLTLTPRELEVFKSMLRGDTSKETALRLKISPRTVIVHRGRVKEKFQLATITDLVRTATLAGVFPETALDEPEFWCRAQECVHNP